MNKPRAWRQTLAAFVLLISSWTIFAQQQLELVDPPPLFGTFFLAQNLEGPYPFDPYSGQRPVYEWRPGIYIVDDSEPPATPQSDPLSVVQGLLFGPAPSPCDPCATNSEAGGPKNWGGNYSHAPTNLWLEITSVVMSNILASNSMASFVIHTPETNAIYDLFGTTNLNAMVPGLNRTNWVWRMRTAAGQTNLTLTNIWQWQGWFELGTMLDGDSDGLTTAYENRVSHTRDDDTDHDDDGILDGVEVQYALNPRVADPPFTISISQPVSDLFVP